MKHTLKFKESRKDDTQRRYECVSCNLGVWFVAPRIFLDYDHRYDQLLAEYMEKDDCIGQPRISIKEIAQKLYDILCEREWSRDDWNEVNYCLSCGASIKGTSLPKHKDDCEFVEATQAFEKWTKERE